MAVDWAAVAVDWAAVAVDWVAVAVDWAAVGVDWAAVAVGWAAVGWAAGAVSQLLQDLLVTVLLAGMAHHRNREHHDASMYFEKALDQCDAGLLLVRSQCTATCTSQYTVGSEQAVGSKQSLSSEQWAVSQQWAVFSLPRCADSVCLLCRRFKASFQTVPLRRQSK